MLQGLWIDSPSPVHWIWAGAVLAPVGCISHAAKSAGVLLGSANGRLVGNKQGGKSQGIYLSPLMCWVGSPVRQDFGSHRTRPLSSAYRCSSLFHPAAPLSSPPLPFPVLPSDTKGFLLLLISGLLQQYSHLALQLFITCACMTFPGLNIQWYLFWVSPDCHTHNGQFISYNKDIGSLFVIRFCFSCVC